jgi:hypothetical protein
MNQSQLLDAFSSACNWNAFLYSFYRILYTGLSYLLFYTLPPDAFAARATLSSIIFITVLWTDAGLQKSLPHFAPHFISSRSTFYQLARTVCLFRIAIAALAAPLVAYLVAQTAHALLHTHVTAYTCIALALFAAESFVATIRLLYHSQFWNKQFNLIETAHTTIEMLIDFIIVMRCTDPNTIVMGVLITRVVVRVSTTIVSLISLAPLLQSLPPSCQSDEAIHFTRPFFKHSFVMWVTSVVKSLSERNFIIPCLTHILGAQQASIYKVANDGALLFYRVIIKTIGSNDTALLSHAHHRDTKSIDVAFTKLTTRIAGLVFPLLGLVVSFVVFLYRSASQELVSSMIFQLFTIIVIGFFIETLIMSYERLVEVHRDYRSLVYTHVPYLCIALLFVSPIVTYIGLYGCIFLVHVVRLVSLLIALLFARRIAFVRFPLRFALLLSCVCLIGMPSLIMIIPYCYIVRINEYVCWCGVYARMGLGSHSR